jgi:hypothetical protein
MQIVQENISAHLNHLFNAVLSKPRTILYARLQWFISSVQQAPAFNEDQSGKKNFNNRGQAN